MKKTLLSGVKSTGRLHIGNYFGAMKQFVDLQEQYDTIVFIADMHSLTTVRDPEALKQSTFDLAAAYLATGLDPERVTLFKQSDVAEVAELAWIFECLTPMSYLKRAHAYKDAEAKGEEINAGTFNYPMLMAADILLYDTDVVPVGKDQKQHLEFARDTAERFNQAFGETFKLPESRILEEVETIPGTDGRKMSKSYDNVIPLFGTEDEIREAVMSIQTDSTPLGEPLDAEHDTVFELHKLVATPEELKDLRDKYQDGSIGYGDSKKLLAERLLEYFAPLRERYNELHNDRAYVGKVLANGARQASERAEQKMATVRRVVGIAG